MPAMDVPIFRRRRAAGGVAGAGNSSPEFWLSRPRPAWAGSPTNDAGPFVVDENSNSGDRNMSRALRCIELAGFFCLTVSLGLSSRAAAADPSWGRLQSADATASNPVYFYNNAAASTAAPTPTTASNATSVTYRSYSVDSSSNSGLYYYSPGPCGCYSYAPGPSPTAGMSAATPNGTAPTTAAAPAPTGTYRSFSPDAAAATSYPGPNYSYSYSGTYYRSTSGGGRSWGSRGR